MSDVQEYLVKGSRLQEQICSLSSTIAGSELSGSRLSLSFDVFCLLLEYTSLVGRLNSRRGTSLEELLSYEELLFDTGEHHLPIVVDFFAPPETLTITD